MGIYNMVAEEAEAFEEMIYNQQFELIKREFGDEASANANYGWGVDETEDTISISTKVYGHGVVTSVGNYNTGEITHDY